MLRNIITVLLCVGTGLIGYSIQDATRWAQEGARTAQFECENSSGINRCENNESICLVVATGLSVAMQCKFKR